MTSGLKFQVTPGCIISSPSSDFEVEAVLGSGSFGEVAQCRKRATGETVALKILKIANCVEVAERELIILTMLKKLHCDKFNIVKWNSFFSFQRRFCLEFEKLDISLHKFLRRKKTLRLTEIRPILQQLATALEFLEDSGIVHADLKPGNIMMVDHVHQPLKVKVIDFGLSTYKPAECTGRVLQTLPYRSPEVLLGAPISGAIDIWSLGCIAAKMLRGTLLFPCADKEDLMRQIVHTVGTPPDHLLSIGFFSFRYFTVSHTETGERTWSLKPTLECNPGLIKTLSDLLKIEVLGASSGEEVEVSQCDLAAFAQLLTEMLKIDAADRITASKILKHPFVCMTHLKPAVQDPMNQEPAVQEPLVQDPRVQELEIQEPVIQEPTVQDPEVQEPSVQEPAIQETEVQEPRVQEPSVQEPTAQEPAVLEPEVQEPAVQEPLVQDPRVQDLEIQESVIQEPTFLDPEVQKSAVHEPVIQEPMVQEPSPKKPMVQGPVIQEPMVPEPMVQGPVIQELAVQEPGIQEPRIQEPAVQMPSDSNLCVSEEGGPAQPHHGQLEQTENCPGRKRRTAGGPGGDHSSFPVPKRRRINPAPLGTGGPTSSRSPGPDS